MSASADQKQSIGERFRAMSTGARTAIIGGCVVTALFGLGTAFTENGPGSQRSAASPQREPVTVFNPGSSNATEALAANLEAARKQITDQQTKISLLEESVSQAQKQSNGPRWPVERDRQSHSSAAGSARARQWHGRERDRQRGEFCRSWADTFGQTGKRPRPE